MTRNATGGVMAVVVPKEKKRKKKRKEKKRKEKKEVTFQSSLSYRVSLFSKGVELADPCNPFHLHSSGELYL